MREYGINLEQELWSISYRRFLALLTGLSAESRFVASILEPKPLTGKAAEGAFAAF